MPVTNHLLERAFQLINANQLKNAELVLDAVVRVDPQNVGAWKTYLMIHQCQNDLDWVKDRILKTRELARRDKVELIEYYQWLTEQANATNEEAGQTGIPALFPQEGKEEAPAGETSSGFELIDVFDYPAKIINKEILTRPRPKRLPAMRRRSFYNPIAAVFSGRLPDAVLRSPLALKLASHIEKFTGVVKEFIKDPKEGWEGFSRSPNFKTQYGVSLLVFFFLSIRVLMINNFLGYLLLGIFIFGLWQWLSKHGMHDPSQPRVYAHENKSDLPPVNENKEKAGKQKPAGGASRKKTR